MFVTSLRFFREEVPSVGVFLEMVTFYYSVLIETLSIGVMKLMMINS